MRLVLPYAQTIVRDAKEDAGDLPRNISVRVDDIPLADKFADSFAYFNQNSDVNSNIITDPSWSACNEEVEILHKIASGRIIGVTVRDTGNTDQIAGNLTRYFEARANNLKLQNGQDPHLPSRDEIFQIAEFLHNDIQVIIASDPGKIVSSTMTYNPNYGAPVVAEGWLNPHIDQLGQDNYDIRIVHTMHGRATVSFSNDDFDMYEDNSEKNNKWNIDFKNASSPVSGWTGPEGSYTKMRTPSSHTFKIGALPTVHAHGLGQENDRRRWTARYDVKLHSHL